MLATWWRLLHSLQPVLAGRQYGEGTVGGREWVWQWAWPDPPAGALGNGHNVITVHTWGNKDKWVWSEGRYGRPKGSLRSVLVECVKAPKSFLFDTSSSGITLVIKAANLDPGTLVNSWQNNNP